jgi:hypothetical protein
LVIWQKSIIMFKLLLVCVLAVHCNGQLVSIGGADYGRTVLLSPHLNGVSSLGSYGLGSLGFTNYGGLGQLGTQSLYGLRPLGGIGLNSYASDPVAYHSTINPANLGFGLVGGLRPQALNLVSAVQPIAAISAQNAIPVSAAIRQVGRTVEYRPVPYNDEPIGAQQVVVEPSNIPLNIHFKSRSSTIRLSQEHIPGEPGTIEQTRSQDEPSITRHEVTKPVIQEVREIVQPYRRITQELQPVIEKVHTIVSKGEGSRRQYLTDSIQRSVQPINPYQTVQAIDGYQQFVQPYGGYQTIAQPNIYNYGTYGTPFYGQQAINPYGQSSYGSFDQNFGQNFGQTFSQRPTDGQISDPRYTRNFNQGFAGPSGNDPNTATGGRGPTDQSQAGPSNNGKDSGADNKGSDGGNADSSRTENTGAENSGTAADEE